MKKFKWNTSAVYMMQRKFMNVRKDLNANHSDSEEHELTPNACLPGGLEVHQVVWWKHLKLLINLDNIMPSNLSMKRK